MRSRPPSPPPAPQTSPTHSPFISACVSPARSLGTNGHPVDLAAAVSNYVAASELAGPAAADAACALAMMYEAGVPGVITQDMFRAAALYNVSAGGGNATARFTMGVLHAYGLFGVPRDDLLATLNYYFAAMGGLPEANIALGCAPGESVRIIACCVVVRV